MFNLLKRSNVVSQFRKYTSEKFKTASKIHFDRISTPLSHFIPEIDVFFNF
jgi:hypothetical protein